MSDFTDEEVQAAWEKGTIIPNQDPKKHRKDIYGNTMFRPLYGKMTLMSWNIDHIIPKSLGGTDHISNLRPMQSKANSSRGNNPI